jgi:hypothetical protein
LTSKPSAKRRAARPPSSPTTVGVGGLAEARRSRYARGVLLFLLVVFVVLGGLGVFGVKTATASATGGGTA